MRQMVFVLIRFKFRGHQLKYSLDFLGTFVLRQKYLKNKLKKSIIYYFHSSKYHYSNEYWFYELNSFLNHKFRTYPGPRNLSYRHYNSRCENNIPANNKNKQRNNITCKVHYLSITGGLLKIIP